MSTSSDVQRLPPENGTRCDSCGNVVVFKLRKSKPCATAPGKMIAYLCCPICGHQATQIRLARRARKARRRRRYVYED